MFLLLSAAISGTGAWIGAEGARFARGDGACEPNNARHLNVEAFRILNVRALSDGLGR
jgi:hypothetical protein